MNAGRKPCPDDDQLDAYVLGTLPGSRIPALEEHLLFCVSCQDRLILTEQFVQAIRQVGPRLREERPAKKSRRFRMLRLADRWGTTVAGFLPIRPWAVAALVAAAVLLVSGPWLRLQRRSSSGEPVVVELESYRGTPGSRPVTATRPLLFRIRAEDVPESGGYLLEMVDSEGERRWRTPLTREHGHFQVLQNQPTETGHYFLRLLSTDGTLLREYSLEITPDGTP